MKTRTWALVAGSGGWRVQLTEVPLIARIRIWIGDNLCPCPRRWCCNPPAWTYRLHAGKPDPSSEDDDPYYSWSLGHAWWSFCQWWHGGLGPAYRQEKHLVEIPVTEAWVIEHHGKLGWTPGSIQEMKDLEADTGPDSYRWKPENEATE